MRALGCVGLVAVWLGYLSPALAEEKRPTFATADIEFFETSIRPLLAKHCFECHGPGKQESGLRLDSRAALMAGGDNGPVVIAGDPANSRLVRAISHTDRLRMPPAGKLSEEAVAALTRWVKLSMPWPESAAPLRSNTQGATGFRITPEDRGYWSFRPVVPPRPPVVRDTAWPENAIDRFVLARLETAGLRPSPPADHYTLIRRVTFDLTGLPPTEEEVREFVGECGVRSAEFGVRNSAAAHSALRIPHSALEKLVDRLLASPRYGERQARHWLDVARYGEDQAHTFQARQYPHGYRYRDWLVAAFNDDLPYHEFIRQQIAADLVGDEADRLARLPALGFFACGPVYYGDRQQLDQISDRIDTLTRGFLGLTVACARCHDHKYDPISTADYYALAGVFASTEYVEAPLVPADEVAAAEKKLSAEERKRKVRPKYPFVHALKDAASPRNLRVHVRGSPESLGDEAPRRFLEILRGNVAPFQQGSGRRELAESIASADNPLTARVMVNRVWQQHFGRGLVRTASNFGLLGERPTHPELLDYLAARFVASGWSLKALHREIVLSATYQQASRFDQAGYDADPENRLLWRMNRRRLEVEAWRDAMLTAAGRLDGAMGGPPVDLASPDHRRRTLYGFVSRHELNPLLRLFDFPDPNVTAEQRPETTVPLQQLFVLNSEFMVQNARALAARLQALPAANEAARVARAIEMLYSRPASRREVELAVAYLQRADSSREGDGLKLTRWERLAQALLAANEFMFVD